MQIGQTVSWPGRAEHAGPDHLGQSPRPSTTGKGYALLVTPTGPGRLPHGVEVTAYAFPPGAAIVLRIRAPTQIHDLITMMGYGDLST